MKADIGFGERIIEITELEAEVVDSERISSGNVLAQLIYSGPLLYLHGISTDSVINCERGQLESTKSSAIIMYPALCCGSSGSVARASS